jgi:hypothetical protein
LLAAAAWAAYNGVSYTAGGVPRHRAESAWFVFAAALLTYGLAAAIRVDRSVHQLRESPSSTRQHLLACAVFLLGSFLLYADILDIGLLSDDFVLLSWARSGAFVDPDWGFVRPLPLATWWAIDRLIPEPSVAYGLHALNVTLHGLNAWLVYRLAERISASSWSAFAGALIFLCAPLSVEPVAWLAGMFDLMLTSCVLLTANLLLARAVDTSMLHAGTVTAAIAALATKETAVALPALAMIITTFVDRARRRVALLASLTILAVTAGYVIWRWLDGVPSSHTTLPSGYVMKELLSRPFGALGFPIHVEIAPHWFVGPMLAAAWPVLLTLFAKSWQQSPAGFSLLLKACLWVIVSIAPVFTAFFVSDDLQGSRYLYLAASLWSITVAHAIYAVARRYKNVVLVVTVALSAVAVRLHCQPWEDAALMRDHVMERFKAFAPNCEPIAIANLPDHVNGAYVFRNGFTEATAVDRLRLRADMKCTVSWNGSQFVVDQ